MAELKGERAKDALEIVAEGPKDRSKSAKKPTKKPKGSASAAPEIDLTDEQEATFTALKKWRLDAARKSKVPAYIVFGDMVLRTIAKDSPDSLVKLARVKGVGPAKLENYGDDVLSVLSQR